MIMKRAKKNLKYIQISMWNGHVVFQRNEVYRGELSAEFCTLSLASAMSITRTLTVLVESEFPSSKIHLSNFATDEEKQDWKSREKC